MRPAIGRGVEYYDAAAVHGFLARHDLAGEYRLNLEVNHATLGEHKTLTEFRRHLSQMETRA